ncbi:MULTISPECIES: hypothetical protein [unclassified Nocardiopsis]|uniref:hypothetical protein n=1 Tax=Nocardiopsis TaxID=2013 RepID=UPI00387B9ADB
MDASLVPDGVRGDPQHIRVGPAVLGGRDTSCPVRLSLKARPALSPKIRLRRREGPVAEDFPLGPVQEAIDRLEFGHPESGARDGDPVRSLSAKALRHGGLARYAEHAVNTYCSHLRKHDDHHLRPVRGRWVVQRQGPNSPLWEAYHWGRQYESPDGTHREFRFLRTGPAAPERRTPAETALAAYVTAFGTLDPHPGGWWEPFRPGPSGLDATAESGRGLALVDALATSWGDNGIADHRQVWFFLAYDLTDNPWTTAA